METQKNQTTVGYTGLKAGALTSILLISYFLLMRAFELTANPAAWAINFIILFAGIYMCYRFYRVKKGLNVDYLPGMLLGTEVTTVTVIVYSFFIYLYFSALDPEKIALLKGNMLFMTNEVTPLITAFATFIQGLSSGIVISFIMMQYYKSGFKRFSKGAEMKG